MKNRKVQEDINEMYKSKEKEKTYQAERNPVSCHRVGKAECRTHSQITLTPLISAPGGTLMLPSTDL